MKLDLLKDMMKVYGMKSLAEKAGVSRTSLYNFLHGENFEGNTLEKVSVVLNVELAVVGKTPDYESVCNHLAYYKAPLLYDKSVPVTMSLEETTKWGLKFSKDDGLLDSVMPFFLLKNFKLFNRARLLAQMDAEYLYQLLGFYLELGAEYRKNKNINEFTNSFYEKNFLPLYMSKEKPSRRALEVLKSKNNLVGKKWNVFSFGSLEDYFTRFRKWEKFV